MAIVQVKTAVEFRGKPQYHLDTIVMPTPDGIVFRTNETVTAEGLIQVTLVPWLNIVSVTTEVGPDFFDKPQPAGEDEADEEFVVNKEWHDGPGELS